MSRYYHAYPMKRRPRPKQRIANLFNETDTAKLEYNKNMDFRKFVLTWNEDVPELLNWTILDFYKAYQSGGYQFTFAF